MKIICYNFYWNMSQLRSRCFYHEKWEALCLLSLQFWEAWIQDWGWDVSDWIFMNCEMDGILHGYYGYWLRIIKNKSNIIHDQRSFVFTKPMELFIIVPTTTIHETTYITGSLGSTAEGGIADDQVHIFRWSSSRVNWHIGFLNHAWN